MRLTVLVLGVVAVGCAAGDPDEDPGCQPRVGSYVEHHVNKSGDCGTPSDRVIQVDGQPGIPAGCTGSYVATELNCKETGNVTCINADGIRFNEKGVCRWSDDGATGSCEVQITIHNADGSLYCTSLFEQTYRRQ